MSSESCIYFNEDNHHFYACHPESDMTEAGCAALVDRYAKTGAIKGLLFCTNVQRALYDSEVWERFRDVEADNPLVRGLRLLSERGVDQFAVWLARCRRHGIEGWLTMRMNDCHGLQEAVHDRQDVWQRKWVSAYWRDNPGLRRAPYREERSWEGAFNYLVDAVREHHLRLVEELLGRHDMTGLELDWLRWGMLFPPGFEREGQAVLTGFVRQVRRLADQAEKRLGHPVLLSHRVPADPESCLNAGFDIPAWGDAGCVDMVTLSSFLGSSIYDAPVRVWRRMLPAGTPVNVYVDSVASSHPGVQTIRDENMLGQAAAAWSCGADTLYLFNECYRESGNEPHLQKLLGVLSDREALARSTRLTAVGYSRMTLPGESIRATLPVPLTVPEIGVDLGRMEDTITVRLPAGRVRPGSDCRLRLGFSAETPPEALRDMTVWVNTRRVAPGEWPGAAAFPTGRNGDTPYPFLPPAAALAGVWQVPSDLLHETFNAVELLPPRVPGRLVWAELLILGSD